MSISFKNVNKRYKTAEGDIDAVNNLSIEIESGEFLCVLGASGAGKSTILRLIAGLIQPDSGTIEINKQKDLKSVEIGMVFQTPALMEYATVYKNIALPLWAKKMDKDFAFELVKQASKKAEVEHLLNRRVSSLSGGEKQRTAIARACVLNPSVFLFDEPLNSLDPILRSKLKLQIKNLHSLTKATFVYVTHDILEARFFANRIALMKNGGLHRLAKAESFFENPLDEYERAFFAI